MKVYQILVEELKLNKLYLFENGDLNHGLIIDKAESFDSELIEILLNNNDLKNVFFIKIKSAFVFNHKAFIDFLAQQNYLSNSYTAYKNKIGLYVNNQFLHQQNKVELVWPYKDCVLEGGQSREEENKAEIFFNQTLAQDEITQLFEPKVICNVFKYSKEGKKSIQTFNRNEDDIIQDNLIIKGNNLLALHSLQKQFSEAIKLIYIDPPYNTGNDSFKYNDSFNTSTWLTFMKNRLDIAKELLHKDGAIFVQCDDNQQAHLKLLMDEIFGKENYRETIVVKTSTPSGVNAINVKRGERLFKVKEYILFYSKNNTYRFKPIYIKSKFNKNYKYEVIKNKHGFSILDVSKIYTEPEKLETYALKHFEHIYSLEKNNKKAGEKIKKIIEISKKDNEVYEFINSHRQTQLVYQGGVFIALKDRIIQEDGKQYFGTLISDLWDDEIFQSNQTEGGVSLPGGKKPEKLLKRILELATNEHDIVLDYHLGSGTTAAVAHKMNRQYIGIEQLDYGENDPVVRINNVIKGETTGISKIVNWKGGGEFVYFELKKNNQLFIEKIEEAKTTKTLLIIWEEMKKTSFLDYNIEIKKQEKNSNDFKKLSLNQQKIFLCEILDKNQLYVNVSSLYDKDFACSKIEKEATNHFYKLKKIE